MKPKVAIIGAGWAGLSAAARLAATAEVTLYEAGRRPGGRARSVEQEGMVLDNGQHILIGAYRDSLALMREVGVQPESALQSAPLRWFQFDGIDMRCPDLPAPLHMLWGLLTAKGLRWSQKWALARVLTLLRMRGWQIGDDCAALDWLRLHGQDEGVLAAFWQPLILATMNTPPAQASMQLLANVLRDSLGAPKAGASRLLLPRQDLGLLLAEPAWRWLAAQLVRLRAGYRVRALEWQDDKLQIDGELFDAAILAVAPYHVAGVWQDDALLTLLKTWQYQPISTIYLQFESSVRLPAAMCGQVKGFGQWWFDREALCGQRGLVSVVISAEGEYDQLSRDELQQALLAELRQHLPDLPPLRAAWQITEQRATFAANVKLQRPAIRPGAQAVYLAGDWLCADYPATLEGAVRSGKAAAQALMQDWNNRT